MTKSFRIMYISLLLNRTPEGMKKVVNDFESHLTEQHNIKVDSHTYEDRRKNTLETEIDLAKVQ